MRAGEGRALARRRCHRHVATDTLLVDTLCGRHAAGGRTLLVDTLCGGSMQMPRLSTEMDYQCIWQELVYQCIWQELVYQCIWQEMVYQCIY